jgi:hypothetical protein
MNFLNIGGGKLNPPLNEYLNIFNNSYFLVNIDKNYYGATSPEYIESNCADVGYNKIYYCNCDIFEFLEKTRIKFGVIFIHRFFEHVTRNKLLYFIYLLSTVTDKGSIIDLISPNYQLLAEMLLEEKPLKDQDFGKNDIILSTEIFNEPEDPHNNITTPDRIKLLFEYEDRFQIDKIINPFVFDKRDIYFKSIIRRI